ncbi:hypothetical protein AB0N16_41330 [Streptomyces sp. NPDC051105]|uniref:hypothetical protein n=1 Tax=Streptomyces sp. NPDC051105 TaxID=3154843 RepID=UPI00343D1CF1
MAVPLPRTVVAALCAGLAATLLTTAPARAEQRSPTWTVSEAAHAPRARIDLDTTPAPSASRSPVPAVR